MTREEAIKAMLDGEEVTSDEWEHPDKVYMYYDNNKTELFLIADITNPNKPFVTSNIPIEIWDTKYWRLRKYKPKDKELVFAYDSDCPALIIIGYYDAKNNTLFHNNGKRTGLWYEHYIPYKGELPPKLCSKDKLED